MNALEAPKVISSVCHGPAAFTTVKRPSDGEWMVKGKKVWQPLVSESIPGDLHISSALPQGLLQDHMSM